MEDKKDFFYFVISAFSLFNFFALNTPPNRISCGWGKKLQVYSWVWTGCQVSDDNNGLMSCFHRILQGHNHDMIVFKTDSSWTETHHGWWRLMHIESLSNTTLSGQHHGPLPAQRMHTMQKLNFKWYASTTEKASKQKCTVAMFFG